MEIQKDLERYLHAEKFRVLLGSLEILCQEAHIRYSSPLEKGAKAGDRRINPAESMAASIFHDSWCPWKNRV